MCLTIDKKKTKYYKKILKEKGKISVYKCFILRTGRLITPYMFTNYYKGETKARGVVNELPTTIHEGGLHSYSSRSICNKKLLKKRTNRIVVRLIGKEEDFIAAGKNDDLCFKKLTIDKREENRLKKWAKTNKRSLYLNPPKLKTRKSK